MKISLSQYRGKVVLLDFWAVACGEIPWYVEFDKKYRDKRTGVDRYRYVRKETGYREAVHGNVAHGLSGGHIAPVDEVSEQRASRALDSGRKKGRHTVIEYDGQITAGVTQHKECVGKGRNLYEH
jgi:hypothetical protein